MKNKFFLILMTATCVLLKLSANAQCSFFLYDTYMYMSKSSADGFEEESRTFGYIRINDTTFLDKYRMVLVFDENKFKWIKNASYYSVPYSCDFIKKFIVTDTFINYKLLPIVGSDSKLTTCADFTITRSNDSILYNIKDRRTQYRYSLTKDTIKVGLSKDEYGSSVDPYKTIFAGRGKKILFGQIVDLLIFYEFHGACVSEVWLNEANMVLIRTKTTFNGSNNYEEMNLVGCYQF